MTTDQNSTPSSFTRRGAIIAGLGSALAAPALAVAHDEPSYPVLDDPDAAGEDLQHIFIGLVQAKDTAGLEDLLAPNFVLQRVVGDPIGKDAYIANLPDLGEYEFLSVAGWQTENVLVTRLVATLEQIANGERFSGEPATYLTTFAHVDGDWRVVAHANFNPVSSDDAG